MNAQAVLALVGVALLAVIGYFFSCKLNPEVDCPVCEGKGKHYGKIFTRSRHQCRSCGGTGRRRRVGTVFLDSLADSRKKPTKK